MKTFTRPRIAAVIILLTLTNMNVFAQCLIPSGKPDITWPVTNRYNTIYDSYSNTPFLVGSGINNIAVANGTYYLTGSFTNLVQNQGPSLVIDSATSTVKTPSKWRINGTVLTAIPDGKGGFYIGGEFTKIGDSIRNYIAQIDANGQPMTFNPAADKVVRMMQIRNDTLYIAGDFQNIFSRRKSCLAMYSIKGDSLLRSRQGSFGSIKSFLLNRDTLILAGHGISSIKKYNIKDSTQTQWGLNYTEYGPVDMLHFNHDSTVIVYESEYNGQTIKAFTIGSGALKYAFTTSMARGTYTGRIISMKAAGNKIYAAGYFDIVQSPSGAVTKKGFFSFDGSTGAVSADQLTIDGYPTFVDYINGKVFISGSFSKVNSVDRLNFAAFDAGNLAVDPWQLSPSDDIVAFAMYNGTAFISGELNGINAVKRNGFAAIDSATKTILPWAPSSNTEIEETKRMLIKGDTLLLFGITSRPGGCLVGDFHSAVTMFRLSDGQQLPLVPYFGSKICDVLIDSGYLYVSADNSIGRYDLSTLTRDASWGFRFGEQYAPMHMTIRNDTIFTVGDNRFQQGCTTHPPREGGFWTFSKHTGSLLKYYGYQGKTPIYDNIAFDHALLVNDKLYIQGFFNSLNGKARTGFACIDIRSGAITDWNTPFTQTVNHSFYYRYTSDLKLYNGKIWFGTDKFQDDKGNSFYGFGAIDTATGILMPPVVDLNYKKHGVPNYLFSSFNNFIFTDKELIGVGTFDYINGDPVCSFSVTPLTNRTVFPATATTITGPDTIYANNRQNKYFIDAANTTKLSYYWTSNNGNVSFFNNGSDTVRISASAAGNALISVNAIDYCSDVPVAQKTIVIAAPPPALPVPEVSGLAMQCTFGPNATAKLTNPPSAAGVSIIILIDGKPVNYQQSDSTFSYFNNQQTTWGSHLISVKYKYTYATFDSASKDFNFYVWLPVTPEVTITGITTVKGGDSTTLSATASYGGTPAWQWQDSTRFHSWLNINGATGYQFKYKPDSTGDKIRCLLTSNAFCASPAQVASKPLSFIVNYAITAVNDIDELSKQISLYPNPANNQIVIDSLQYSDHWLTLDIIKADGQKAMPTINIQNKINVTLSVLGLKNGLYVALLKRKDGRLAVKPFIKN